MSAPPSYRDDPPELECKLVSDAIERCESRVEELRAEIERVGDHRQELQGHLQCLLMGWPTAARETVATMMEGPL